MARSKRKSRFKDHAITAGAAMISLFVIGLVVAAIVSGFRCRTFKTDFAGAAAEHLPSTSTVTVAAITSARAAAHAVAVARGLSPEKIKSRIERRTAADSSFTHVVAFEVKSAGCEPSFERVLDRQLTADELRALAEEGIDQCRSCIQDRHHHHLRDR